MAINFICTNCGNIATLNYDKEMNHIMAEHRLCFDCAFWLRLAVQRVLNNPDALVVSGIHYMISPPRQSGLRGFGGRTWYIKFHDGRYAISANLWCQGEVAENFRHVLSDNAVFLTQTQFDREMEAFI